MSKIQHTLLAAIFLMSGLMSCGQPAGERQKKISLLEKIQSRGKLIVGTDYHLPGLGYLNLRTNEVEGFEPDIAREIAKKLLGDERLVEFVLTVPENRLSYLSADIVDLVIANMTITPERSKIVNFSDPYFIGGDMLLVRRGSLIKSVQDLAGKRVGVVKDTTTVAALKTVAPDAKFVVFEDIIDAFASLRSGHVDAISSEHIILYLLKASSKNPGAFELVGKPFAEEPWGIAIEKGNEDLLNEINGILRELKESGRLQELYEINMHQLAG